MIIMGITEIAGSIVVGRLCDRFHGRYVLCGAYALRGLALLTLALVPHAFGSFLGLIWLVHQFGAAASSEGGAIAFTEFGSYQGAIVGSAIIAFVSFLLVAFIEPKPSTRELADLPAVR
jgi:predicted MFS family arabinose efflux permease